MLTKHGMRLQLDPTLMTPDTTECGMEPWAIQFSLKLDFRDVVFFRQIVLHGVWSQSKYDLSYLTSIVRDCISFFFFFSSFQFLLVD